ncbi:MAG: GldG family protein [Oscillospiraceae bacterium]|nr:GldG family protein [Oscillospiraceae bacterium]
MQNEENKQSQSTDELNEQQANVDTAQNTEDLSDDQGSDIVEELTAEEYAENGDAESSYDNLSEKEKKERFDLKASHKKLRSAYALKHGVYATAITAIFIAGVIIFNVLATALATRFPLQIDLTADSANSISDENAEYLSTIAHDVKVIVCSTKEDYTGDYFKSYVSQNYTAEDPTGKYFSQTVALLGKYPQYNNKISVEYADTSTPDFSDTLSKYSDSKKVGLGDILVESTFDVNGVATTRTKHIAFTDIYTLGDESGYAAYGYGAYTVSGSKLETALTSAIYAVTSEKTTTLGVPTMYSDSSAISGLASTLESNNYTIEEISSLTLNSIPSELDGIIIAAPPSDLSAAELSVLDSFLDNGGKKGKMLLYFPSVLNVELPNLEEFLAEWGVEYLDGTLYETNEKNIVAPGENTIMGLSNNATDYTKSVNDSGVLYINGDNSPMNQSYDNYENRTTTVLMSSSETTVIKPTDSGTDWAPTSSSTKQSYPTAILCEDTTYDDDNNKLSSFVVSFSSADFIGSTWSQYSSVGNIDLSVSVIGATTGRDSTDIAFVEKSITNQSFADKVTAASSTLIMIIFIVLVPVALIILGITIWIRRKNR